MFYGGFGAILTPLFGVSSSFADDEAGYNNALGFFCILWTVFNTFFLLGPFTTDAVTIATCSALEIYLCLLGASYFVAGMLGYYSMGNAICKDQGLPDFLFPMGNVKSSSSSKQEMRKSSVS